MPSTSDERVVETRDPEPVTEPPNSPADVRHLLVVLARSQAVAHVVRSAALFEAERRRAASVPRVTRAPRSSSRSVSVGRVAVSGSCSTWLAAAGVTDLASAHALIARESKCDPYVYNRAGSGACGVGQALPCSKTGCAMGDGACQVRWMNTYVLQRYGSWANAEAFQRRNGWY